MDIKETISKVPTWGWIAGGGLVLGLVLLMSKGSGGSTVSSTGGVAPDANSLLGQLQDAANSLGGGGGSGSGSGSGSGTGTTPTKTLTGYSAKIASGNRVATYDKASGKLVGYISGLTVTTAIPKKINGLWWYQITSGKYKGRWFKPGSGITWTKLFTTAAPTTTTNTSSVQTSNNTVN